MREPLMLVLAGAAGVALGALYFGGLWWTVRRSVTSPNPARLVAGSLLVRMSLLLAGFSVVGRGHWERLLACMVGVLVARYLVTRLLRTGVPEAPPAPEAGHAA